MLVPGGLYNTTWFHVMNEAKWDRISPEDQAAIEAISGLAFAERMGQAWIDADLAAKSKMEADGIEIYTASATMIDAIAALAAKHEADWAASVSAQGYDGAAALADLRDRTGVGQ